MDRTTVIKEWLRDSAIGFFLILGGFTVGGLLAQWFQTDNSLAYTIFLCIGGIPFMWFAGKRLGYFPPWKYAALFGLIVATAGASVLLERFVDNTFASIIAMAIVSGCFWWLRGAARTRLKRNSANENAAQ
jgi:uncharacterized membrane protein YccC